MKEKDYNQFDSQIIVLKKDVAKEIIISYESFGWEIESEKPHPRYENLIEVKMSRNHFVENKDDLQFLQVNMESDIIKWGRLKKSKHSKSTILGITLAVVSFALFSCSALIFTNTFFANSRILPIFLVVLGIGVGLSIPFICHKIYKNEKLIYEEKEKYYRNEINNYKKTAEEILGAKNGE